MTESTRSDQIEFIHLGGHAVRVTSWTTDEEAGTSRLVTITRGSRDAELLDDLLEQSTLSLKLPGEDEIDVSVKEIDRRTFGEGQAAITRFAVVFNVDDTARYDEEVKPPLSLEDRVAALETEVATLRTLVHNMANNPNR
jgi:hypothetical protein